MIEWPSKEAAVASYESHEYRPYRDSRLRGSRSELIVVPGEDLANVAQIDA